MGVITTPFSRLVVRWYLWISEQVMTKEATQRVSLQGQWLNESNEGASFSSLSCPVTVRVLAWA